MKPLLAKITVLLALSTITVSTYAQDSQKLDGKSLSNSSSENGLITKGASITIKVAKFEDLRAQLITIAAKHQGTLSDSKTNVSTKGRRSGWFRMSVPQSELDGVLVDVRATGKLVGEQATAMNRSAELAELDLRRNRLETHTKRLTGFLNSDKKMRASDVLFLQSLVLRSETDTDMLLHQRRKIEGSMQNASVIISGYQAGEEVTPAPVGLAKIQKDLVQGVKEFAVSTFEFLLGCLRFVIVVSVLWPMCKWLFPRIKRAWKRAWKEDVPLEANPS